MVITGINLRDLMEQYSIAPSTSYDQFSVTLHLSDTIRKYKCDASHIITYGEQITEDIVVTEKISHEYILYPGQAILACSIENVNMPKGYMGIIQTKGSLARLFVTVHCCDGQIEPGFSGRITFEICNMGQYGIRLLANSPVAQMYIVKVSDDTIAYEGRYMRSTEPTYSNPKK